MVIVEEEALIVYKALYTEYLAHESYLHPEPVGHAKLKAYLRQVHELYKKLCVTQGLPDEIQAKVIDG